VLGAVALAAAGCGGGDGADADRVAALEQRVAALEARLATTPADAGALQAAELDELVARLDDADPIARWRAARELRARGEAAHPRLVDLARTGSGRQREAACAVLADGAVPDQHSDLLALHAEAADPAERALLARALARTGRSEAVDPLVADLGHPSRRVRLAAADGLGRLSDPRATVPLLRVALHDDAPLAAAAREALAAMNENAALFVGASWSAFDPRQRQDALRVLGPLPGDRVEAFLEEQLRDASPLVALEAALQLARRGNEHGATLANQRLKSDDPVIARAARDVLDTLERRAAPPPP
jgi:HEAT repeat protein